MDSKCKLIILVVVSVICVTQCQVAELCTAANCLPPDCRCSSEQLGAGFTRENTPQLVMVTFDSAVTAQIYDLVMPMFDGRFNPDGCRAAITYFASHEYTDYSKVHSLWANGHELALNSISHASSLDYWRTISMENLTAEFGDQRQLLSHFAQINSNEILGIRIPSFQMSGDNTFKIISELELLYDSTWPTQSYLNGLWPYTLDYRSTQDCPTGNCPTASIPGVWVIPNTMWIDTNGIRCAMLDACSNIPSDDLYALVDWLKVNFHRQYDTTKAPFPIYLHGAWFLRHENHLPAFSLFLDYINSLPDVYFVSQNRVIEYMRDPRSVGIVDETTTEPEDISTDAPDASTENWTSDVNTADSWIESTATDSSATDSTATESTATESTTTDTTTTPGTTSTEPTTSDSTTTITDSPPIIGRNSGYQIFDQCQAIRTSTCLSRLCSVVREDVGETRWMTSCAPCPSVFPWKHNPLGVYLD